MGNYQTKNKNVVVEQDSVTASTVEAQYNQLSMWLTVIASLLIVAAALVLWNRFSSSLKSWLRKQVTVATGVGPHAQLQQVHVLKTCASAAPAAPAATPVYG